MVDTGLDFSLGGGGSPKTFKNIKPQTVWSLVAPNPSDISTKTMFFGVFWGKLQKTPKETKKTKENSKKTQRNKPQLTNISKTNRTRLASLRGAPGGAEEPGGAAEGGGAEAAEGGEGGDEGGERGVFVGSLGGLVLGRWSDMCVCVGVFFFFFNS